MKRTLASGVLAPAIAVLFGACAQLDAPWGVASRSPAPQSVPAAVQLSQLLADSDEALLRRNPVFALFRGDMRYAAQHGDYLSNAYVDAERAAAQDDLRRLDAIDRTWLTPVERIAYDSFAWQRGMNLRQYDPARVSVWLPRCVHRAGRRGFDLLRPDPQVTG